MLLLLCDTPFVAAADVAWTTRVHTLAWQSQQIGVMTAMLHAWWSVAWGWV